MTGATMDASAYDALWAAGWDDTRLYGPMARHGRRLMKKMTQELTPKTILDVGCGEGSLLRALMTLHPNATGVGIDVSDKAITLAKTVVPDATFNVCDIAREALDQTFDLVVSADVLEHMENDSAAIKNLAAMTAPGGHLIIATLQGRMRAFERQVGHVRNYAHGELEEKIMAAGLRVERTLAWGWPLYSPLYRNLLNALDNRGTMGRFGPVRKFVCHVLYALFMLNRSTKGDYLFVRAVKED